MQRRASFLVLFLLLHFCTALADTLFVATLRAPAGSSEAGGRLYRVDPATARTKLVGRILLDGSQPVGVTGMAFSPQTNVLYAVTAGIIEGLRPTLITIDPGTAEARVVGRLSHPLTDVSFDASGRLYAWTADTGQLATVDVHTGKVATIGAAGEPPVGGGFAIDSRGNAFVAAGSAAGTLDQVDLTSGSVTTGPSISGTPYLSAIGAMAFSAGNELYAANSIRSARVTSALINIDLGTGTARVVGELPEDSDALAFTSQESLSRALLMRWIAYGVLAAIAVTLVVFYLRVHRPSRPR